MIRKTAEPLENVDGKKFATYCSLRALAQPVLITADEYRMLPETGPQYQLIEGELYMAPAPRRYHQDIAKNLLVLLQNFLDRTELGVVYQAPFDVYLTEHNVYQPDLLFLARERMHLLREDGVHGAPNLVVEVLSPRTARLDRDPKRKVYAAAGVEELWLTDPDERTIEIFRLQTSPNQPESIYRETDAFHSMCFPGLTIQGTAILKSSISQQ